MDDDDKFRMKKKAAGALLKVKVDLKLGLNQQEHLDNVYDFDYFHFQRTLTKSWAP